MVNHFFMHRRDRKPSSSRERRTQAERRARSEQRILEAAAELFSEQGYVATTMEQIGARAGYSAALIARKFGSKPGVVEALLATIRSKTSTAIDPDGERSVVDNVRRYVALIADGDVWLRALYVLMAESLGPLRDMAGLFAHHNRTFIASIVADLGKAQRRGVANPSVEARSLATRLVASIRGITLLWLIDPKGIDFLGMTESLLEEFQRALESPYRDAALRGESVRMLEEET
jgi:AcrR family transcriptional regulator